MAGSDIRDCRRNDRDASAFGTAVPGYRAASGRAHPGLYGACGVKRRLPAGADGCRLRASAAAVKAGRRPPPEAARSGLEGGGARRDVRGRDVLARAERADV